MASDPERYLPLPLYDLGLHCYRCGDDHGFAFPRSWMIAGVRSMPV